MNWDQDISYKVIDDIKLELSNGNCWFAYNNTSYRPNDNNMYFFRDKDEAFDFANSNISEYDNYTVLKVSSLMEVLNNIPAGEQLLKVVNEGLCNQNDLFTQKTNFMNQKNVEYLKDQVKFTGFGDALENEIKEKMQKQAPEFQISHSAKFGNDSTVATLHFKKSDQSDMYFFNRYNLSLKPEHSPDVIEQTFYINKGSNITLKEGYNLMSGRAINKDLTNKEGQMYNAWLQMDFKKTDNIGNYKMQQFHQNYGFDLDKVLTKHSIKELNNEQDKNRLIESLQRGNKQSVTFIENGNEQKRFIEANPQFKIINIYDGNMLRVLNKQSQGEHQGESVKQEAKKENQQNDVDDGVETPKALKDRRKKPSQTM